MTEPPRMEPIRPKVGRGAGYVGAARRRPPSLTPNTGQAMDMDILVTALTAWVAAASGLPQAPDIPSLERTDDILHAAMQTGHVSATREILGAYDGETATIFLTRHWDAGDPVEVSILVHELVHHLQHRAGMTYPCPEAREALAFKVQAEWLARFDTDLEADFEIDAVTLKLRTECLPW